VYPWIAEETPNATEVLNYYEAFAAVNENVRVSGPHSLRWIPRAAFALDQFPVLEGKVGERIVRSWFDTVMNPILKNLRFEQSLLESRNWTWRVPPGRIELIRPVAESPYGVSTDNLGQFASVSFFTFAGELIDRHDTELLKLEAECKELNALLSRSKVLEQALKTAAEDNSTSAEGGTVNSVLLRGSVEEHLELLAQYIVNTTNELPGYNVYSVVWAKHRIRFLAALEDPLVTAARDSVLHAGRTLLNTSVELIDFLVKVRDRLSLQFDIPIVRSQTGQE
jgi:hypothetical protein